MAVSKRLRYEILRRDNHTCRYCGATAPEVNLTVDHVVPVALGGSDDPSNLVTACQPCNAGKSASAPDAPIVADIEIKTLLWAQAMKQAAAERVQDQAQRSRTNERFLHVWNGWTSTDRLGSVHQVPLPDTFGVSIHQFLEAGLEFGDLAELIEVAMNARTADVWRYFCGCCWRRIRAAQDRAAQIVSEWEANDGD